MTSAFNSPKIDGRLSVVRGTKLAVFESGDINSTSVVIFVGGLGDGLGSVGYVYGLSDALKTAGWCCACVTLSSAYSQFGRATLEQDATEIGLIVDHLRHEIGKDKIVLLGHSTGCQDAMWYTTVKPDTRPKISAAILQAPVSDVEAMRNPTTEILEWIQNSVKMVSERRGSDWLPKKASIALGYGAEDKDLVPYTAYRFASLFVSGGDDDFFSSTIDAAELKFSASDVPLLVVLGDRDGSYPPSLYPFEIKQNLLDKWRNSSNGKIVPSSTIIRAANHTIDDPSAREEFYRVVISFLQSITAPKL